MLKQFLFSTHDPSLVEDHLSNLQPLNYNQFRWWRRWDTKNKPLDKKASLLSKIKNGDFDFSHYFWQVQKCELEINEKSLQSTDSHHWMEVTSIDRARRLRLWGDFEKDENEKLQTLENEFPKEFYMTIDDYYNELDTFDGTLEEFYVHCQLKFKKRHRVPERRGRPPKNR